MHDNGIGRAGYRLLAVVFFAVGLGGLALAWTAARTDVAGVFTAVGLATAGAAHALLLLTFFATTVDPQEQAAVKEEPPAPAAPRPSRPVPELHFEYEDPQPAASAAPEHMVLPKAFQEGPPTPGGEEALVAFEAAPRAEARPAPRQAAPATPAKREPREELRERYTRNTPTLRRVLEEEKQPEAPVVRAERCPEEFDPDWIPDGKTRGRCGGCSTTVLAPTARPVRLKCPQCGRITLLK